MEKITKKEMFTALINWATTGKMEILVENENREISMDELIEFANHEIEQLDKKSAKAKEYSAKKKACNDELTDAVRETLTEEFEPIAEIASRIEGEDVTVNKVTYRLSSLVQMGEAEKQQITLPATETSKARKVQAYRLKKIESPSENE